MSQIGEGGLAIPKHVFSLLLVQLWESRERGVHQERGVEGFVFIVAIRVEGCGAPLLAPGGRGYVLPSGG